MKTLTAKVISDKMRNTAVVQTERMFAHPLYNKRIKISKKMHVHNEIGAKTGDEVKIEPTRPISKTKFWNIIEILKKNDTA
jgi:small subunit ribosomal protein S17